MPVQQETSNYKDCSLTSEILQKHSINSLLEIHSDDLIVSPARDLSSSPVEVVDVSLSFDDAFPSMGTLTPKGYDSLDNNKYLQKFSPTFENFQFDNRLLQRNLSFDCNVATPTTPSTPSTSSKIHMSSPSSYGNGSNFLYANNINRSDSPLIYDAHDNGSLNLENQRSLVDLTNNLNLNTRDVSLQKQHQYNNENHQHNKQDQQQFLHNDIKQMQAFHLFQQQQQQQQQQLNSTILSTQPFHQQIFNRFSDMNVPGWRQQHQQRNVHKNVYALDNAVKHHRSSAAFYEPSCTWSGVLPPRTHRFITYSPKVFLGGIPWDINEQTLIQIFRQFGQIKVEWPGKDQNSAQPKGYVYIVFESERQVKALLQACSTQDSLSAPLAKDSNHSVDPNTVIFSNMSSNYYYKISSKRIKEKDVEIIPWIIGDSNYIKSTNQKIESGKTVFVGALHGKLTAEGLAKIMNDLFDGVIYAGIDTDKYKYPIGSGRVTFNNTRSYMRAVAAAFIEIKTSKFNKKVQIDPYLEDSLCSMCGVQHGTYYCRELSCFRYFCRLCWQTRHANNDMHLRNHKPLTRNSKSQQQINLVHSAMLQNSLGKNSRGSSTSSNSYPASPNDLLSIHDFHFK